AEFGEARWFIYKNGSTFSSQLSTGLCSSLASFALIQGVPEATPTIRVSDSKTPALLLEGLKKLGLKRLFSVMKISLPTGKQLPWKAIAITCITSLMLYFAAVSVYL